MTGRVAGIDRQMLETSDAGPMRVDDECGGAVGRRLDGQREDRESRDAPLPQNGANERDRADNDRQHDASGNDRAEQRRMCSRGGPVRGEPNVDTLVSGANAPRGLQHLGDEKSQTDREHRDCREAGEHRDDEDKRRVKAAERTGQPLRRAALASTENGHVQPVE